MRYQEYFLSTNDSELYRLELHEKLGYTIPLIKKQAEQVLGCKIRLAAPIGALNDQLHFDESSEVQVAFYLQSMQNCELNQEMTEKLQDYFSNLEVENIGVIHAIVLH